MPICHQKKFIFFHIPRCGGTSIERFFNLGTASKLFGVVKVEDQERTLHHLTPSDLTKMGLVDPHLLETYFKFTIIRDPFARMASDYLWQQQHDLHGLFKAMNFAEYLDFAESVVDEERYFERVHFDHFRPMASYCLSAGELAIDDILLLENIDDELKRIQPLIGAVTLPKTNSSPNYEYLATRQNIQRVNHLYAADRLIYEQVKAMHFNAT